MNNVKKRFLLMLSLVGLFAMLLVGCSSDSSSSTESEGDSNTDSGSDSEAVSEDPTYTLRFGHVLTEQDPFHEAMVEWADAVKEKTDGDLVIDIYPSGQLGVEEDVLEQMRMGSNVGWQTDAARLGNYVNELSVLNAPYFIGNLEEVEKLQESEVVGEWIDKLAEQEGIEIISFAYVQGNRNVFSNKKGLNPEEFKDLSIRAAGAPIWVESVKSLGSEAVALPYGELYNGIQTGVVDGAELPYTAAYNMHIHEVADYILETQHIYQMNFQVISAEWFNSLPEEYKTIVIDEANKSGIKASQYLQEQSETHKQALIDEGMEYIPHEDLDIAAFKKSGQAAYDALNLNEARDAVYEELGKTVE
jgi:TRAP-type C4-dicarboxylate transport system substrate-binding protein